MIRRLQLEYGPRCHIDLDSQLGHGTRVTIRLPIADGRSQTSCPSSIAEYGLDVAQPSD